MNAPVARYFRFSVRHTTSSVGAMALVMALVACDKKADGAPSTGSGPTTTAPAAAEKKPATTLKLADLKHAYRSEFDDMSKAAVPMDKKVEAFVAKVGKPESESSRTKTWYALDSDKCTKVVIDGKDGSMTEESTANADCGM